MSVIKNKQKYLHSKDRELEKFWQIFRIFPKNFWYLNIKIPREGRKMPQMTAVEVSQPGGCELIMLCVPDRPNAQ